MKIEIEVWQCFLMLVMFFGAVAAWGKLLFAQFEKRLAERFTSHEELMSRYLSDQGKTMSKVQELERDWLLWRGEMPNQYVRRDDFIRNQTVIEAKLDTISQRVQNIQLTRNVND
jgi:hypothetical protein